MVGAIRSPTDAASLKTVVGSVQVVARAWALRDATVQHYLEYLGSSHPNFELERSARSVVQFEGVLPKAAPCIAYAPVDLDGQIGVVVDVSPEVHELVRSVERPASCLYAEYGGGLRHPLLAETHDTVSV